jgi:hypothetical protein
MNEKPIERLNYFNGQRLQAADLKLEQDYHLRVRRWLNRSLYSSGIADGLVVNKVPGVPKVRIGPGLALDEMGREIILIDEHEETVAGAHDDKNLPLALYLTIRYGEELLARQDEYCTPASASLNKIASGGPSRVVAEPVFEWNRDLPHESSGKVVLAYVALGKGCKEVNVLDTNVRRYIGAASAAKVKQYALEGESEVAAIPAKDPLKKPIRVTAKIRFHIRGRQPNSVTLYLKAREFSALYYTELGQHTHGLTVSGMSGESVPELNVAKTSHLHPHGTLAAASTGSAHDNHTLRARKGYVGKGPENTGRAAFFLIERNWGVRIGLPTNVPGDDLANFGGFLANLFGGVAQPVIAPEVDDTVEHILNDVNGVIEGGAHSHTTFTGSTGSEGIDLKHKHSVSGSGTADPTGVFDSSAPRKIARAGKPLGFVYDLKIAVDGLDATTAIVEQVVRTAPSDQTPFWTMLGNGNPDHPLADETKPAIPIRIDYLPGVILGEGEHSIECSVNLKPGNSANGGRVHYNLYVE